MRNNQNKHRNQYSPSGYQSDPQAHATTNHTIMDTSDSGLGSRIAPNKNVGGHVRIKKDWLQQQSGSNSKFFTEESYGKIAPSGYQALISANAKPLQHAETIPYNQNTNKGSIYRQVNIKKIQRVDLNGKIFSDGPRNDN